MDSKGHLFYAGNFELFTNGKDIFKAPKDCPVDIYGYRQGARFECPDTKNFRDMLNKIYPIYTMVEK
jgi:hypothetical protein